MARSIAINVGANTTLPGIRGPLCPDGSFVYLPIPERKPTVTAVPTYEELVAKLDLPVEFPTDLLQVPVHLDPSFASYPFCTATTYGDEHAIKAGPITSLSTSDYLFFYATLDVMDSTSLRWVPPTWGAFLIGAIKLSEPPVTQAKWSRLSSDRRHRYTGNAHCKRIDFDAKVLVYGEGPGLFERAIPLSLPEGGTQANSIVTDLAGDSGRGPWWRRVLQFDEDATAQLLEFRESPGDAIE